MTNSGTPSLERLPNGLTVLTSSRSELRHFYEDIFVHRVYVKNGIELSPSACVLDVGANIGLFSLFVLESSPEAQVYAFEPIPELFALLVKNLARHDERFQAFNVGVGAEAGSASFTYYPRTTGMSSFYPSRPEEEEVLRALVQNEVKQGVHQAEQILPFLDEYVDARLETRELRCTRITLGDFLTERPELEVDLLKIDVQKSEWDVLQGLTSETWHRIRQVVMEVHDLDGRLSQVRELLEAQGFTVLTEQDDLYTGSPIHNLYARRGVTGED